jgi:hypothetical protein
MRLNILLPVIFLALLSACAQQDIACAGAAHDEDDDTSCVAPTTQYVRARPPVAPLRVVPVQVDSNFSLHERAKILRAVNEWNHVLNGHLRLDISPESADVSAALAGRRSRSDGWIVGKVDSRHPMMANMKRALAVTIGTRKALVLVSIDRLGSRDLGGIMMHEFGHALGASHDPDGKLMHPYYTGNKQRCIDKGAAHAVAAAQRLPLDSLNWCGG